MVLISSIWRKDNGIDLVCRADIATLRTKHHICGLLTGTLPHLAQQNIFLGVPLVLMPEEVVLLVEKSVYTFDAYNFPN